MLLIWGLSKKRQKCLKLGFNSYEIEFRNRILNWALSLFQKATFHLKKGSYHMLEAGIVTGDVC